jgi:hypothetical protein
MIEPDCCFFITRAACFIPRKTPIQKERNGLVPTLGADLADRRVYTASACVVEDAVEVTKCAHGRIDQARTSCSCVTSVRAKR